jgi:hypothetical protein
MRTRWSTTPSQRIRCSASMMFGSAHHHCQIRVRLISSLARKAASRST